MRAIGSTDVLTSDLEGCARHDLGFRPLFENFEAFGASSEGVKQFRSLILSLAVSGKLVPQNPLDDPAQSLIEKINEKRLSLIESKVIGAKYKIRDVSLPVSELPPGWVWANFGDITFNRDGDRVPVRKSDRECQKKIYEYYGASGVIDKVQDFLFDQPLLLIGEDGANLVNRSTPIAFIAEGKYWVNNHAHVVDSYSVDMLEYLRVFINSIRLEPYITGMAQPKMNQARLNSIPIAVPPLAEQRRIVAKVDSLMSLCDTFESQRQERESCCQRASRSVFASLTSAPAKPSSASTTTETLASAWQRLSDHFEVLLDTPETINDLRQSILQLAVQGTLVPQDSAEGDGRSLAEEIRSETLELIDNGELKSPKVPTALPSEMPELPSSWTHLQLADVLRYGPRNGYSPKPVDFVTSVKSLTLSATTSGIFDDKHIKYIDEMIERDSHLWLKNGDFLIQRSNSIDYVGMTAIYNGPDDEFIFPDLMMKFRVASQLVPDFVQLVLRSEQSRSYFQSCATGTSGSMRKINQTVVVSLPIPVPPIAEQKRVVSKVSTLLSKCDELAERLRSRQSTTDALLTSLVHQILEGHA